MIDKIKIACSNVGVEAVILNSDRGISAQLNSLTKDMDLPIMLMSWDIESVISFDTNGNLTTPVASLTILLLKKPYELTRGDFVDCSEEMQNTFFNFLKVLRPLLIGEMRSMSDEPIFNIKTKLVPSYGTSKHSGVMATFNMLGDSVTACQVSASTGFYDDNIKPLAPSNIQINSVTDFQAYITWDDATDDAMWVCHRIFLNGEFHAFAVRSQYLLEGLEPGTTYNIEIDAFDRALNYSEEKESLTLETASISITFPTRPTDVQNGITTNTTAPINWGQSYDENGLIDNVGGYNLYIDDVLVGSTGNTNFEFTNLDADTTYYYKIEPFDLEGNLGLVASGSIKTSVDTENPSEVSNLTSSNIDATTATLSWGASTDNLGVTGYRIYLDSTLVDTTTNLTYNLTNLTAETTYSVEVEAFDLAGNNSAKVGLSITTISSETLFDQFTVRAEAEGFIVESHDGIINTAE